MVFRCSWLQMAFRMALLVSSMVSNLFSRLLSSNYKGIYTYNRLDISPTWNELRWNCKVWMTFILSSKECIFSVISMSPVDLLALAEQMHVSSWVAKYEFTSKTEKNYKPRSSNSRSRSASWSLRPCRRPRLARAIDGGICNLNSVWPRMPLAAAAWAWACTWSCWHVAYILNIVAIKKTPSTSQSCK